MCLTKTIPTALRNLAWRGRKQVLMSLHGFGVAHAGVGGGESSESNSRSNSNKFVLQTMKEDVVDENMLMSFLIIVPIDSGVNSGKWVPP